MPGSSAPAPGIVFDPVEIHPDLRILRAATTAGDWPMVTKFFARCGTADEASFGVSIVSETPEAERLLEEVVAREPLSSLPRVILAARYVHLAWDVRTAQRAKHVSKEQFAGMRAHLCRAEPLLVETTAREPANVLAWSQRLTTGMGLELGQSEARRRYDRLAAHNPRFLAAQRRMLQQVCPKWGGSWETAHAFAEECRRGHPAGGLVVADVHLEHWLELGRAHGDAYLRRPDVHQDLVAAAQGSVLHPEFRSRYGWLDAHSTFALMFSLIGDWPRAAAHFRAMGGAAGESRWGYLGDAGTQFHHYRAIALARG